MLYSVNALQYSQNNQLEDFNDWQGDTETYIHMKIIRS